MKCCFCKKELGKSEWAGNNPAPLKEDGVNRCCDECNATIVIPERIARMQKYGRW